MLRDCSSYHMVLDILIKNYNNYIYIVKKKYIYKKYHPFIVSLNFIKYIYKNVEKKIIYRGVVFYIYILKFNNSYRILPVPAYII